MTRAVPDPKEHIGQAAHSSNCANALYSRMADFQDMMLISWQGQPVFLGASPDIEVCCR